jgi:hypothetical protein
MPTYAKKLYSFFKSLKPPTGLPRGVEVLFPQQEAAVMKVTRLFFDKFYNDDRPRRFMVGINPGRFGAGITGINFTGPRQLKENCGIDHPFGNSSELSAEFIYEMIDAYGGVSRFYKDCYIAAMSPLGYTKAGKNLNYYDEPALQKALLPFINDCLSKQLAMGFHMDQCACIGGEKNYKFFSKLNEQRAKEGLLYFEKIIPVPHPRFIMQYRRKTKDQFIHQYVDVLRSHS